MPPLPLSFGLSSFKGKFRLDANVRAVNAYARQITGGRANVGLYATPGLKAWISLPTGPYRGGAVVGDLLYVVSGRVLYVVTPAGDIAELAGIPGDAPVQMVANALDQPDILLAADSKVWWIKGAVCTPYAPEAVTGSVVDVDFVRGRFVLFQSNGQFYYTRINSIEVEGDAFYNAEGKADGLVGGWVRRQEVWLLGSESTELWAPTTDVDDPFGPLGAGAIPIGCKNAATIAENSDDIFWVDNNNQVRRAQGYTPKEISPEWVVEIIEAEPNPESLRGFSFALGGLNWYVLMGSTFCLWYNLASGQWIERQTDGLPTWRGVGAVAFAGHVVVGDHRSGQLWRLTADHPFDGDVPIHMRLQSGIVHAWPMPLAMHSLHVDVTSRPTMGDVSEADRTIALRLSEDGGGSWFAPLTRVLGERGAASRVIFRRLGTFERQGATVELVLPAVAAGCVKSAVINAEQGST
jgi:hypothetical protein